MVYSTYNAGEQRYLVSGSGIFVAPNLILTVAHNFLEANKETGEVTFVEICPVLL